MPRCLLLYLYLSSDIYNPPPPSSGGGEHRHEHRHEERHELHVTILDEAEALLQVG